MHNSIPEITPTELKQRLDSGEEIQLIDVREPFEHEVSHITNNLIPLSTLPSSLGKVVTNRPTVLICRSGARSLNAAMFLRQNGVEDVYNLTGGMKRWAVEIDPSIPVA